MCILLLLLFESDPRAQVQNQPVMTETCPIMSGNGLEIPNKVWSWFVGWFVSQNPLDTHNADADHETVTDTFKLSLCVSHHTKRLITVFLSYT